MGLRTMDALGKLLIWCLFKQVPDMLVYAGHMGELNISKNEN